MLVSLLTPVYNVQEKYLRQSIESMCKQTLADIQIILVNDGSTDPLCGQICEEYAARDSRIQVVHQQNSGPSAARNRAISMAKGEYLLFVDSDDWIERETCEVLYRTALKHNLSLLFFGAIQEFPHHGKKLPCQLIPNTVWDGPQCRELQGQFLDFDSNISDPWGKLIRRSFLQHYSVTYDEDLRLGEGILFGLQLLRHMDRAMFLPEYFYHYRYNENSISQSYNEKNSYNTLEAFRRINAYISTQEEKSLENLFQQRFLYFIITTAISGYFNPQNTETYSIKKKKYAAFLDQGLVRDVMAAASTSHLSKERRIAYFFICKRIFLPLILIAYLRKIQRKRQ